MSPGRPRNWPAFARTPQHLHEQGWERDDIVTLYASEVAEAVVVDGALGGYWTPHCPRLQPAKLVQGLAAAVERQGVTIVEGTTVTGLNQGALVTDRGTVRAKIIMSALEGYQSRMPGGRREILPMNSSMIVTEPLSDAVWQQIGWRDGRLLGDHAHSYSYSQHTRDGRIAIGGRGVPYRFGSTFEPSGITHDKTVAQLKAHLDSVFPAARESRVDHAWSGILGVPRDWTASVTYDLVSGLGGAGGYTGHGLAGTNLAARTLADLIIGSRSELTNLAWVGRTSRSWEPEPLRWVGARALYVAYRYADRCESQSETGRTHPMAKVADKVSGRH